MTNNRYKIKPLFLTLLCLISIFLTTAQRKEEEQNTAVVRIHARAQKDKILLRWAVNRPIAWLKSNDYGFLLEKYLFSKNGNRLPVPQKLWEKAVKADPLETWQEIVEKDDYAAVIAQALYGESFAVEGGSGALADIVNTTRETEQRFSFALLAADMNFEAAKKAGWGFEDTDVKAGERYVYRIAAAVPKDKAVIRRSSVIAGIADYEPLPALIGLQAVFGDKSALLAWDYQLYKSIYVSYNIERSEDSIHFKPLGDKAVVNLNDKPEKPAGRMYYIDSLSQNDKTYFYRIYGISPFGEKGGYSKTVFGKGKPVLPYNPRITGFSFTKTPGEAVLRWEFPVKGEALLAKFRLNHAENDKGPFKVVIDSIAPSVREITYSGLQPSNYFSITAIGKTKNQQRTSFTAFVQAIDSTAPLAPVGLNGKIDSLGVARFSWQPNSEKDMLGYRIFRAFNKEEPSQLTAVPIVANEFTDSLGTKSLNTKVYYRVVAVDKRYNHSGFSKPLVLEKPDMIAPDAPVFSGYKVVGAQVQLQWIPSSKADVKHLLLRKNVTDKGQWEILFQTQDTLRQFTDKETTAGKTYSYKIRARDKATGLFSPFSIPLTVRVTNSGLPDIIKEINSYINRDNSYLEIFWRAEGQEVAEYTIYKQSDDQPPATWRIVPANIKRVVDQDVKPNTRYTYHIRANLKNGTLSKIKTITIKF